MAGVVVEARAPAQGLEWLRRGMRLYASRPAPLFLLNTLGIFVGVSLGLLPWIGPTLFALVYPAIQLGTLTACRTAASGAAPGLDSFAAGLHTPALRLRLVQLGAVLALVTGVAGLILEAGGLDADDAPAARSEQTAAPTAASAPERPRDTAPATKSGPAPAPATPASAPAPSATSAGDAAPTPLRAGIVFLTLLLLVPVHLAIVFATILVGWHGQTAPKALFFAAFAVWRNRGALLLNLLALSAVSITGLFTAAAAFLLAGIGDETARQLLFPVLLLLLPIASASNFAMVHDILVPQPPAADRLPAEGAAGQG